MEKIMNNDFNMSAFLDIAINMIKSNVEATRDTRDMIYEMKEMSKRMDRNLERWERESNFLITEYKRLTSQA